jgi:hypothetical protein
MPRIRRSLRSQLFPVCIPILVLFLLAGRVYARGPVVVTVDRSTLVGTSHLSIGVTLTGPKWENGNPEAVRRAKALLTNGLRYINQHLMNWGTEDPEPKPGVYKWASLDKRIALIRSMGCIPIITFCSAPGWMNTTGEDVPHQTGPYSWADARVADNHVNDFAELCKRAALRYRDVKYFQIWNEYKGYWDKATDNWDYRRYTNFYNAVYDAVKSVRPDAKLGGPYYPFDGPKPKDWTVIDYWLKHKHGADFVCFDGWIAGYPPTRDRNSEARKMTLTDYFGKIADQFRARTDLPIWISEFYGGWSSNPQFTAANHASCYLHALLSGVSVVLLWDPELQRWNYLFTSTKTAAGGQPSPHYQVVKIFNSDFGPGTRLYRAASSSANVEVLASATKTLLINKRDAKVEVRLNGRALTMGPYEVRVVDALNLGQFSAREHELMWYSPRALCLSRANTKSTEGLGGLRVEPLWRSGQFGQLLPQWFQKESCAFPTAACPLGRFLCGPRAGQALCFACPTEAPVQPWTASRQRAWSESPTAQNQLERRALIRASASGR